MQFPTLTSGSLAALILLAPNAVNAASKIGGDGRGCCSHVGAQGPPGAPLNWCENVSTLYAPRSWHMYCVSPLPWPPLIKGLQS
ncbi:hypothetical protein PtrM4_026290 [Pyrenophora tritici-repentis]|uniref:Uncharacterized protein n=1 Tax=Pyrenophora tritici-repentis TaxID=45151 RepID=A0A834S9N8_9PLEO|nr:hypothetical protein A1F99_024790 [Pyrenophora tritici-repentis]KAF7578389.1 hypothetical protein PtrM4_026290 [Pyrenophora tritici-repentis]